MNPIDLLTNDLVERIISQAPDVVVLLYVLYRLDRRMSDCFAAMKAAMDKLLEAVVHETADTR